MTKDFVPPTGWRLLGVNESLGEREYLHHGIDGDDEGVFWVRAEAESVLPTAPYTIIKAVLRDHPSEPQELVLLGEEWRKLFEDSWLYDSSNIVGFEVLAVPSSQLHAQAEAYERHLDEIRDETAKAVISNIRRRWDGMWRGTKEIDEAARDFGVQP